MSNEQWDDILFIQSEKPFVFLFVFLPQADLIVSCMMKPNSPYEQGYHILLLKNVKLHPWRHLLAVLHPQVLREGVPCDGARQEDVLTRAGAGGLGLGDEPGLHTILRLWRNTHTHNTARDHSLRGIWARLWGEILLRGLRSVISFWLMTTAQGSVKKHRTCRHACIKMAAV